MTKRIVFSSLWGMRGWVAGGLGAAVAVALALVLFARGPKTSPSSARPDPEPPPVSASQKAKTRRSVLENVTLEETPKPSAPATPSDSPSTPPSPFAMLVAQEPALSGLEIDAMGDSERERLKVPDRFGRGVVIRRVHPDSPAAEVGLEPQDVIVRAMRENVDNLDDLKRVVGQRDHTVLIASRRGELMELVIQKPYDGS